MVVKNSHFHLILNHWFQFYFTIATHDRVFHDDLYTSINFWAAREIRTFFEQKNDLIWFFSNIWCFNSDFLHMKIEPSPRRCVWTATARHPATYSTNTKGRKKAKTDVLRPRTLANICSAETFYAKRAHFQTHLWPWFSFLPTNRQLWQHFLFFSVKYN